MCNFRASAVRDWAAVGLPSYLFPIGETVAFRGGFVVFRPGIAEILARVFVSFICFFRRRGGLVFNCSLTFDEIGAS